MLAVVVQRLARATPDPGRVRPSLPSATGALRSADRAAGGPPANAVRRDPRAPLPAVQAALRGPGRSLDPRTRGYFEPRFEADLGDVRVHANPRAHAAARALDAHAFTIGRDIFMRADRYGPDTPDGRLLLAHELAHVVQQVRGRASRAIAWRSPSARLELSAPGHPLEREAETAARAALRGRAPAIAGAAPAHSLIQRQEAPEVPRLRTQRTTETRLRQLLVPESDIWNRLNPETTAELNCIATAGAVATFLTSGGVRPAPPGSTSTLFRFRTGPGRNLTPQSVTPQEIEELVARANTFVVVRRTNPGTTHQHWFVVANLRGQRHWTDRYRTGYRTADLQAQWEVEARRDPEHPPEYHVFLGEFEIIEEHDYVENL